MRTKQLFILLAFLFFLPVAMIAKEKKIKKKNFQGIERCYSPSF